MFDKIRNMLTDRKEPDHDVRVGDQKRRIQIATAVILLEVAYADYEFSTDERERIVRILKDEFSLDDESVLELLQIYEERRRKSIDIWHFTEIINRNFSEEEKCRIIDTVWQVIYADGKLDKYEDYLVHKLSTILHLSHQQMIEAKLRHLPEE